MEINQLKRIASRGRCGLLVIIWLTLWGISNAQDTQFYGYARTCFNGETWQNKFIAFTAQNPADVGAVSETFPEIFAATYMDGYVWFVTTTRSLCKAPFDEETQTIGAYETVVPAFEQYNLVIDMAYNPQDGMMYYLCQDSQYNSYLKRSNLATLSEIETIGGFGVKLWTLAINSQGQAYGVSYEGGNLYRIDLTDAATTLVGPTGKEVWYTQSMAFDMNTDNLYWAQFATASDHGLYEVNTETGAATSLGTIGQGTQLTGLFMVSENVTPEPEIISEIYVEGFTEPVWGEHPDFDLEVPSDANYFIDEVKWFYSNEGLYFGGGTLYEEDVFNLEDVLYYMSVKFAPAEGYVFSEDATVYYNGDASPFNPDASMLMSNGKYLAMTRFYTLTDPTTGVAELTLKDFEDFEGQTLSIYDMTGRLVFQGCYHGQRCFEGLKSGIYVVNTAGHSIKVMIE